MAKLPGRIPANTIKASAQWMPPELDQSQGSQTIRLWSADKNRKVPKSRIVGQTKATAPDLKQSTARGTGSALSDQQQNQNLEPTQASSSGVDHPSDDLQPPAPGEPDQVLDTEPSASETAAPPAVGEATENVLPEPALSEPEIDLNDQGYKDGFETGEKAGYEAGLAAGKQAGELAAKQTFEQEVSEQRQLIARLVETFSKPPSVDAAVEASLADLVTMLTKTVVMGEVSTERTHIQRLVSVALSSLPSHTGVPKVFVNPSDTTWVQDQLLSDAEIIADGSLARGGCRIETKESLVEAAISDRIRAALLQSLAADTPEEAQTGLKLSEKELQQYEPDASALERPDVEP